MLDADYVVRFTRQELYELVWTEPVYKIAPRLRISNVGLAKACKRMQVPVPYLGYWQKLACGVDAERTALPVPDYSLPFENETTITAKRPVSRIRGGKGASAAENVNATKVTVPKSLKNPHRLVVEAEAYFSRRPENHQGVVGQENGKVIALRVSLKGLARGLRIYNALFRSMEKLGFKFSLPKWGQVTMAELQGQQVLFRLSECLDMKRLEPRFLNGQSWGHKCSYTPNGKFKLLFLSSSYGRRSEWRDSDTARLEGVLGEFVDVCLHAVEQGRIRSIEEARLKEIADRQSARHERIVARAKRFSAAAGASARALRLRAYIDRVRATAAERGELEPGSATARWVEWAEKYVDSIDPLAGGRPLPGIRRRRERAESTGRH